MLGTWRLDTKNEHSTFMRQAIDPVTARPVVQQACNSCRVKKLRCSGEKTGCTRCKTSSRPCVYAQPPGKGGSGRKKRTKSEAKEAKQDSGSATEQTKWALPSPMPTAVTEAQSAATLTTTEPMAGLSCGPASGLLEPVDFGMGLGDQMQDIGGPFDVSDGFAKMREAGPGSPSSIEQWLVSSPSAFDAMADPDFGMFPWPNEVADPSAFSVMTSPTLPVMMTPPLSTPALSTSPAVDGFHSSPSGGLSPSSSSGKRRPKKPKAGRSLPPGLTTSSSAAMITPQDVCQCLQHVVFYIDELDSIQGVPAAQLDAGLASHREAVRHGETMIACGYCASRPENMSILTFLTERLANLCERIVGGYFELTSSPTSSSSSASTSASAAGSDRRLHPAAGSSGVFFGDYEVDSASEWELLVRNLIVLQLRQLSALVARVKEVSGMLRCDTPWRKAACTEKRVAKLLDKLNSVPAAWDAQEGGGSDWI
ncbi:hypothetical protein VTK26DRAFT_902 [Humicola hyalothermophila]